MTTVRLVLPHEYHLYREHLKQLDAASRNLRFGYPVTDAVIDVLCDKIENDKSSHILFCIEDSDLTFVAVGHIAISDGMELALSVLKPYQGMGLGTTILERCIQWCRTRGLLKGCMVCLTHNRAIQHLCRKLGIELHHEQGEVLADIDLTPPLPSTYISEQIDSTMAILGYISNRARLPWSVTA